jgi:peptide/nickel transport system permease protein
MRSEALLLAIVGLCLLGPLLAPRDPLATDTDHALQRPDLAHLFGTDELGRDVLSQTFHGGQRTLTIALGSALLVAVCGGGAGLLAATENGLLRLPVTAFLYGLLAIPSLVIALVILTITGGGWWQLILATGVSQIAFYAQVVRTAIVSARIHDYVAASGALGAGWLHITRRHLLPAALPVCLSYLTVVFGISVINSAALSYLGLAGNTGAPDWGTMLANGRVVFQAAPWVSLPPGIAITLLVYSANRTADKLAGLPRTR